MPIVTKKKTPETMGKKIEYEVKPVKLNLRVDTFRRIKVMAVAESVPLSEFIDGICLAHLQGSLDRLKLLMEGPSS